MTRCKGTEVNVTPYDFGVCQQTGYHDAGERITCATCGREVDVREMHESATETGWVCNARIEDDQETNEPAPTGAAIIAADTCPF